MHRHLGDRRSRVEHFDQLVVDPILGNVLIGKHYAGDGPQLLDYVAERSGEKICFSCAGERSDTNGRQLRVEQISRDRELCFAELKRSSVRVFQESRSPIDKGNVWPESNGFLAGSRKGGEKRGLRYCELVTHFIFFVDRRFGLAILESNGGQGITSSALSF